MQLVCAINSHQNISTHYSDPQNNPYDSVQMIFFFERKGLGNNVEFKDSLVLQFSGCRCTPPGQMCGVNKVV